MIRDLLSLHVVGLSHQLFANKSRGISNRNVTRRALPAVVAYFFTDALILSTIEASPSYKISMYMHHIAFGSLFAYMTYLMDDPLMKETVFVNHMGDMLMMEMCSIWLTLLHAFKHTRFKSVVLIVNIFVFFATRIVNAPLSMYTLYTSRTILKEYDMLKRVVMAAHVLILFLNSMWFAKLIAL